MKKINKEVQKIIKDFKIKPSVLKEIKPISDEEFAKASFRFTIDLINYTRCCAQLFCNDCNGVIKQDTWVDDSLFACKCDNSKK